MAFNGSGTFNRLYDWTDDAAAGTKISSTRFDAEMDGMATGLTTAICKDGQTTPTANLPMGNFKHTGVAVASARTDYCRASQDQDSSLKYASAGGTADAITLTLAPAITAYAAGQRFHFIASGTNTGAVTLNVNGVGATAVKKAGGTALVAGDIVSAQAVSVVHDGTDFELENIAAVGLAGDQTIAGTKTFSGTINFDGAVDFDSTVDLSGAVLQGASPLVFEGSTADADELTLAVADPTEDRTITLPDATGVIPLTLASSFVQVTAPADTSENILATISLPANQLGANGMVRVAYALTCTSNANAKTIRSRFGGIGGTIYGTHSIASSSGVLSGVVIGNRNATNSQAGFVDLHAAGPTITTSAVDTTAATTIVITAQKATAGDTITLEHYAAYLLKP